MSRRYFAVLVAFGVQSLVADQQVDNANCLPPFVAQDGGTVCSTPTLWAPWGLFGLDKSGMAMTVKVTAKNPTSKDIRANWLSRPSTPQVNGSFTQLSLVEQYTTQSYSGSTIGAQADSLLVRAGEELVLVFPSAASCTALFVCLPDKNLVTGSLALSLGSETGFASALSGLTTPKVELCFDATCVEELVQPAREKFSASVLLDQSGNGATLEVQNEGDAIASVNLTLVDKTGQVVASKTLDVPAFGGNNGIDLSSLIATATPTNGGAFDGTLAIDSPSPVSVTGFKSTSGVLSPLVISPVATMRPRPIRAGGRL